MPGAKRIPGDRLEKSPYESMTYRTWHDIFHEKTGTVCDLAGSVPEKEG